MRRSVILIAVVAFLAVTALWWVFFISPRNAEIDDANARVEAAQADAEQLELTIQSLERIKENEVSYIFAIGEMETSVPVAPELDAFIEDITFLAQQSGVELGTLSTAQPVASPSGEDFFDIAVSLDVEGEYFEILGFLFGLEDMERLVRVDTVSLVPGATIDAAAAEDAEDIGDEEGADVDALEVDEPRLRVAPSTLRMQLSARMFTRTPVSVQVLEVDQGTTDGTAADQEQADQGTEGSEDTSTDDTSADEEGGSE